MPVQGPEPIAPRLADALTGVLSLPSVVAGWRQRQRVSPAWTGVVAIVLSVVALPIVTVLLLAINPSDNIWPHLVSTVLPGSLWRTLLLSTGVAAVTLAVGTGAAWLVTMYRFPGREVLDRLLVLPLAVPTYIIAYCYVELFDYAGPVQTPCGARSASLAPGTIGSRRYARSAEPCSCCRRCSTHTSISRRVRASRSSRYACWRWRARSAARRSPPSPMSRCHWLGRPSRRASRSS